MIFVLKKLRELCKQNNLTSFVSIQNMKTVVILYNRIIITIILYVRLFHKHSKEQEKEAATNLIFLSQRFNYLFA